MNEKIIEKSIVKELFQRSGFKTPNEEEFSYLYDQVCDLVLLIDETLMKIEERDENQQGLYSTPLRNKESTEHQIQIRDLAPHIVSGLFCVPGLKHIEE